MSQSKAQLTNPLGTVNITDGVNVTGVITATTFIGDGTALTGIALTGNINTSGIITASEFYGYGGDLDNVGLGTEDSINTTGIITAAAFYGDGSGLTGIGGDLTPLTFTPSNGSIDVGLTTNISILFIASCNAFTAFMCKIEVFTPFKQASHLQLYPPCSNNPGETSATCSATTPRCILAAFPYSSISSFIL
jgi:hypothetical protein